jgi:hypothetical protein
LGGKLKNKMPNPLILKVRDKFSGRDVGIEKEKEP